MFSFAVKQKKKLFYGFISAVLLPTSVFYSLSALYYGTGNISKHLWQIVARISSTTVNNFKYFLITKNPDSISFVHEKLKWPSDKEFINGIYKFVVPFYLYANLESEKV